MMLANMQVWLQQWSHKLSSSVAMMIVNAYFDCKDDLELEVRVWREPLKRASLVTTMIANDWFICDDAREWACLNAMMDCEQVLLSRWWLQMRKFDCDDGRAHNRVRLTTMIANGTPFDCGEVCVNATINKFDHEDFRNHEQMHQLQTKSSCNCNSRSIRSTITMFARANNHNNHKQGNSHNQSNWLMISNIMMFVKANYQDNRGW